jgi:hypothetical protein
MGKRSSLNNPRWVNKKQNIKLHKMGIDFFITLEMLEKLVYYNTYREGEGFSVNIHEKSNDSIKTGDIEEALRFTLKYKGLDFWVNMDNEDINEERMEHAKLFVKRKFPRWHQDNARHFMEDNQ